MKKCRHMRQLRPETGESLAILQNTDPIVFVLFIIIFDLLYQRGYQRQYFWTLKFKSVGLWGSYGLKQRNTLKILKFLIKLYLFCLLIYFSTKYISKRLSEVRSIEIKWIFWPMRQIHPETVEYLVFFSKH